MKLKLRIEYVKKVNMNQTIYWATLFSKPTGYNSNNWEHDLRVTKEKLPLTYFSNPDEADWIQHWELKLKLTTKKVYFVYHFHDNYSDCFMYFEDEKEAQLEYEAQKVLERESFMRRARDKKNYDGDMAFAEEVTANGDEMVTVYERYDRGILEYPDKGSRWVYAVREILDDEE